MKIEVEHENGYKGILYGNSSLIIMKDNKEVVHTGSRNIHTKEALYTLLGQIPEFFIKMNKLLEDIETDEN